MTTLDFWSGPFGHVLGTKLILVLLILMLNAIHDFVVGPQAVVALCESPASEGARRLRRRASWFGRINLLLALIVVALGVMLVRGRPW